MHSPITKAAETAIRHEYTFFSISRDFVFDAVTTIFVPFNGSVRADQMFSSQAGPSLAIYLETALVIVPDDGARLRSRDYVCEGKQD